MMEDDLKKANAASKAYLTNPLLRRDGSLANKYINYQKAINQSGISDVMRKNITEATGIVRTVPETARSVSGNGSAAQRTPSAASQTAKSANANTNASTNSNAYRQRTDALLSGAYANSVGKKVANTGTYQNNAALGQCVWYVRGRMKEKLGFDVGSLGNANEMWYNAKPAARVSAAAQNIRPNMLASYKTGTSAAGQKYGHVIYIEDVVGDTVYYTEGGSGYHKNGTDGVIKTATKEGILNGVNSSGSRFGGGLIGLIDLSAY